jgi:hypothetical protein
LHIHKLYQLHREKKKDYEVKKAKWGGGVVEAKKDVSVISVGLFQFIPSVTKK